ncbi:MAG: hypothetical protein V2I24_15905 [Halieaceae bacterium]|jgi:hypothetical protein|nr:hypothetical protein [Halieaceae bacterium]
MAGLDTAARTATANTLFFEIIIDTVKVDPDGSAGVLPSRPRPEEVVRAHG